MASSREVVTEDLLDPTGKKLVLMKYPADFDITSLQNKKVSLETQPSSSSSYSSKRNLLRITQEGDAVYDVKGNVDPSAWEVQGLRPVVLNKLSNEPMIGDAFIGCITVVRRHDTQVEENVDVSISGYNVRHQQIKMAAPNLPFGSSSLLSSSSNTNIKRKNETKQRKTSTNDKDDSNADSGKKGKKSKLK